MSANGQPPTPADIKIHCPHCSALVQGFAFKLSVNPGMGIFAHFGCDKCHAWICTQIVQLLMAVPELAPPPPEKSRFAL